MERMVRTFTIYHLLFTSLARLELERNVRVAHALALVGVRLPQLVHLGCDLPQLLLVYAGQRQRSLVLRDAGLGRDALCTSIYAFGERELNRVRIAEREDNLLALYVRLVADADHVHLLREAFGHAHYGVVSQGACEPVRRR